MAKNTDTNVLFTTFVVFIVDCMGLMNGDVICPAQITSACECHRNTTTTISVRCTYRELQAYPHFGDTKVFQQRVHTISHTCLSQLSLTISFQQSIRHLDVSFNSLKSFPNGLEQFTLLETLDLSYNHIEAIASEIRFPVNLRTLSLASNKISNWLSIHPNTLLQSAINLHTLDLAGNALKSFSTKDEHLLLISDSLKWLDLSECKITKISGPLILSGLVNLEYLSLSGNPITGLPDIVAKKMFSLDLSRCQITDLRRTVFSHMPKLTDVNLSENHLLSLTSSDGFVESESIRHINLSRCNVNAVELNGMPNVSTVILRNNLISQLTNETFQNNTRIENLDLSYNSINYVSTMAFRKLKRLKMIDLSFNMIREIEPFTFVDNNQLTTINLSRNYIERLRQIHSRSIGYLNVSWCEITAIDGNALDGMTELIELDLSNNLLSELGNGRLESKLLHVLDLSRCR